MMKCGKCGSTLPPYSYVVVRADGKHPGLQCNACGFTARPHRMPSLRRLFYRLGITYK